MMGRFLPNGGVWLRHDNAEPFGSPRRICPKKPKTPRNLKNLGETSAKPWWNLGETVLEPWWNLPRNLLSAQDGSAPETHRESKSNSALKPLLWLKTPKLLLLGEGKKIQIPSYRQVKYSQVNYCIYICVYTVSIFWDAPPPVGRGYIPKWYYLT